MQNWSSSGLYVPPHPDISEADYHRILARLAAENHAREKRLIKRSERVGALTAEYRNLVDELMGKGKYARLCEYLAEVKAREARQLQPPKGLELRREEIDQLAAARREEVEAFLRKLGTNPKALAGLNERFQARLQKAAGRSGKHMQTHGQVVVPEDVPEAIRNRKTNPWTLKTPPYDGYHWSIWQARNCDALYYIDQGGIVGIGPLWSVPATGRVGSRTNVMGDVRRQHGYVVQGSGADIASLNIRTYCSVGFWYRMDQATLYEAQRGGQLEVWIDAQAVTTRHRIDLYPYAGWETAWVDQNNYITLRATAAAEVNQPLDYGSQSLASRMIAHNSGSTVHFAQPIDWFDSYFTAGDSCWTHQYSARAFAVNQPMWVEVGMENVMDVSVGQVDTDSDMEFDWIIKSVQLRARRP